MEELGGVQREVSKNHVGDQRATKAENRVRHQRKKPDWQRQSSFACLIR